MTWVIAVSSEIREPTELEQNLSPQNSSVKIFFKPYNKNYGNSLVPDVLYRLKKEIGSLGINEHY